MGSCEGGEVALGWSGLPGRPFGASLPGQPSPVLGGPQLLLPPPPRGSGETR